MRRWLTRSSLLAVFLAAACAAIGGDYLPRVGPPPLRFEMPAGPSKTRFELPPLAMKNTNEVAASTVEGSPTPTTQNPSLTDSTAPSAPGGLPAESNLAPPAQLMVPQLPAAEPAPLYPQMFLQYFTRGNGTNGPGASVLMPLNFTPPMPALAPSSSATYEVIPAHKP